MFIIILEFGCLWTKGPQLSLAERGLGAAVAPGSNPGGSTTTNCYEKRYNCHVGRPRPRGPTRKINKFVRKAGGWEGARSSARLERGADNPEVPGSNPGGPTTTNCYENHNNRSDGRVIWRLLGPLGISDRRRRRSPD